MFFLFFGKIKVQFRIDESNDRPSSPSLSSDEIKTFPTKHRRKSLAQSKRLPSANRSPTIPMILSLIDSLVDEKELQQNNDENLLLTIDNLIDNLKHLREKIQTVHHDDTHPLNLTKPKSKQHTNEQNKSSSTSSSSSSSAAQAAAATVSPATTNNFQLPSALFSSQQPFFSPFAGRNSSQSKKEFFLFFFSFVLFLVANMTHLQNYFKLSAASVLNDSIVGENRFLLDVKTKINFTFRISKTEIIVRLYHLHFFLV